jgi:hypothetical protein
MLHRRYAQARHHAASPAIDLTRQTIRRYSLRPSAEQPFRLPPGISSCRLLEERGALGAGRHEIVGTITEYPRRGNAVGLVLQVEEFGGYTLNNDGIQRRDLRLVLFLRLHKVDGLDCLPMSASGKRWNYATACIPLD